MTVSKLIILIWLVFCLYQIAAIILNKIEIRRLRDIRYRMKTQHSFGIVRHQLMMLVATNKISSKSITFLTFYLMNTNIMRHPDKYNGIAKMLRNAMLDESRGSEVNPNLELLKKEQLDWSPEVRQMVSQNVEALNILIVHHSPLIRVLYTVTVLAHRVLKNLIKHHGTFSAGQNIVARRNSTTQTIVRAKNELQQLAGTA